MAAKRQLDLGRGAVAAKCTPGQETPRCAATAGMTARGGVALFLGHGICSAAVAARERSHPLSGVLEAQTAKFAVRLRRKNSRMAGAGSSGRPGRPLPLRQRRPDHVDTCRARACEEVTIACHNC